MKTKNRVLTGLFLSTVLVSGLFASANYDMAKGTNHKSCCPMEKDMHKGENHVLKMFRELGLTAEQKIKIEQIIIDVKKSGKTADEAFTKDGFDKAKYIEIMNERRDNMIESEAEIIEKSYAILTAKQKEQLRILMDLRKERMNQKIAEKIKG